MSREWLLAYTQRHWRDFQLGGGNGKRVIDMKKLIACWKTG